MQIEQVLLREGEPLERGRDRASLTSFPDLEVAFFSRPLVAPISSHSEISEGSPTHYTFDASIDVRVDFVATLSRSSIDIRLDLLVSTTLPYPYTPPYKSAVDFDFTTNDLGFSYEGVPSLTRVESVTFDIQFDAPSTNLPIVPTDDALFTFNAPTGSNTFENSEQPLAGFFCEWEYCPPTTSEHVSGWRLGAAFSAFAIHNNTYAYDVTQVHHTFYESEVNRVSAVHELGWSQSAFAVHNTLYSLLDAAASTSALAVHEISWSSVGSSAASAFNLHDSGWSSIGASASSALALHQTGWASIGSSQSSAGSVHHASWDSFIKIPGYAVHEVSWASSGGTAMVLSVHDSGWASTGSSASATLSIHESGWSSIGSSSAAAFTVHSTTWASIGASASAAINLHETGWSSVGASASATSTVHDVSWNSIGAGAITSVFAVHQSGWGTGITPYSVHVTAYQSVVESLAVHHTGWNSFVVPDNFAVHEARYRSYSLDPQFILANAYIEPDILLVAASVTADEDSPYYQCEVELRDSKNYHSFQRDQAFVLHLFADEYHFVVDSRNLARTIDESGNYQETATISGLSPLCLKAAPRSTPVTKTWTTPTYASAIVEELIGPVTWNLVDWLIPGYRLAAESADPFDVAQQVVTAAGGLIESQPDGSVVVRHRWPTSIAELDSAPLAGTLYETVIYAAQEQPTQDALMNRIRILDSDAGFQDRLEYVPNKLGDESDDPWNGIMYAYPSPWREKLRIATTRGLKIQLGAQGESVLTVDGEEAETITFESGKSSTRYPIMTLNSFEWLDENLGGLTFSAYSTTLEAGAEGDYYGHSLAKITYTSRRLQVPVVCQPSTGEIEAQFLLLENQDG